MQRKCRLLLYMACTTLLVILYRLVVHPGDFLSLPQNKTSQLGSRTLPPDNRLVDLDNFSFLTNQSCNDSTPFIVAIVHSAPGHNNHRQAIRRTWGRTIRVFFLIGESDKSLEDEEKHYNDIVRGSFVDSYHNLTYKHAMGLKWVLTYCPGARYILKTDDDVFVNVKSLREWLLGLSSDKAKMLLACQVNRHLPAIRYTCKWRVTFEEYPGRFYPTFCSGWAIVYSPDVIQSLYTQSTRSSYFWIDDVYITGILAKEANLTHYHLNDLAVSNPKKISEIVKGKRDDPYLFLLTSINNFDKLEDSVYRVPFRNMHINTPA